MAFRTFSDQQQVPVLHRTGEIGDGGLTAAGTTPDIGQQQFLVLR